MAIEIKQLKNILEAALMASGNTMSIEQMLNLFTDDERPSASTIKEALDQLRADCEGRGIELKDVASGYRYQARQETAEWVARLYEEKPPKYSRAFLETLALIAYRQPVTRAEIEDVRGVSVSSNIVKAMLEREWIRVVGHRDVPGRPALYATTKQFLDYFNMKSLEDLPSLAEIKDLEDLNPELQLPDPDKADEAENNSTTDSQNESGEDDSLSVVEDSTETGENIAGDETVDKTEINEMEESALAAQPHLADADVSQKDAESTSEPSTSDSVFEEEGSALTDAIEEVSFEQAVSQDEHFGEDDIFGDDDDANDNDEAELADDQTAKVDDELEDEQSAAVDKSLDEGF